MLYPPSYDALRVGAGVGGSQEWYRTAFRRLGGCGPTTAALLVWHLAQVDPAYSAVCAVGTQGKEEFLVLMDEMFGFVTPRWKGVDTAEKFTCGLNAFFDSKNLCCGYVTFALPAPGADAFISAQLQSDRPIAFLNLHSGTIKDLDDWHWMTIIGYEAETRTVVYADQGAVKRFDFAAWCAATKKGGFLVALSPMPQPLS